MPHILGCKKARPTLYCVMLDSGVMFVTKNLREAIEGCHAKLVWRVVEFDHERA